MKLYSTDKLSKTFGYKDLKLEGRWDIFILSGVNPHKRGSLKLISKLEESDNEIRKAKNNELRNGRREKNEKEIKEILKNYLDINYLVDIFEYGVPVFSSINKDALIEFSIEMIKKHDLSPLLDPLSGASSFELYRADKENLMGTDDISSGMDYDNSISIGKNGVMISNPKRKKK